MLLTSTQVTVQWPHVRRTDQLPEPQGEGESALLQGPLIGADLAEVRPKLLFRRRGVHQSPLQAPFHLPQLLGDDPVGAAMLLEQGAHLLLLLSGEIQPMDLAQLRNRGQRAALPMVVGASRQHDPKDHDNAE